MEAQPSAAPFHDWNERVTKECYRAVVAARVPAKDGRIADIVNTLEFISFNFGPTLLEWMEREAPRTYASILDADAKSKKRTGGYGNAIAQAYHHTILPLASRREKVTEVRWGIADFRRRFGREPTGMWLPETALDAITLDVLAQEGIAFTVVGHHQIKDPPPLGLPGLFRTPGGRSVALFVYNGPLSHAVAFGSLLEDAEEWARNLVSPTDRLTSLATDGETYGHHHAFGEMALAAVLGILQRDSRVRLENFSSFLARHPPEHEVEIIEPSSWSCTHGVERWRSDCGCKIDPTAETSQEWRSALRAAVDWLSTQIHEIFLTEGRHFFEDPWSARDRYGMGFDAEANDPRGLELLELERQSLRLSTSCAWFFDDLARLEPIQVLRYAARAMELAGPARTKLEEGFLQRLKPAFSNESPPRDGRSIFLQEAKPGIAPELRVAAGAALWDAVSNHESSSGSTPEAMAQDGGSQTPSSGPRPDRMTRAEPGVRGFQTRQLGEGLYLVTHRRTRREWRVETRLRRPSAGRGAVAVRLADGGGEFIPIRLMDLPEGFRLPIRQEIVRNLPDVQQALTEEISALANDRPEEGAPFKSRLERIRGLVELHVLLDETIPFDAQTIFFRFLQEVGSRAEPELIQLTTLLGFTSET